VLVVINKETLLETGLARRLPPGVTEQPDMNFHRPSLKTIYCAYKTILNGLN